MWGCDSSVRVSSWRKLGCKFIYESSWQRSHEFCLALPFFNSFTPKKKDTKKSQKIYLTPKENNKFSIKYSGFNSFPQLPPLRNPFQSFWSSALVFAVGASAFEPKQPMAKSRDGTGGACVSADQKTAGGNAARWRLWASSWPSTNGMCLQQVLKKHQGRFCQVERSGDFLKYRRKDRKSPIFKDPKHVGTTIA